MQTHFICKVCGSRQIAVECIVIQNEIDGTLEITEVCDKAHTCNECGSDYVASQRFRVSGVTP